MQGSKLLFLGVAVTFTAATLGTGLIDAPPPVGAAATPRAAAAATTLGPAQHIQHVVVIYQENHSFDETLGAFCQAHAGRCDGYVGPVRLADGTVVNMTPAPDVVPDVWHDVKSQNSAVHLGAMDGWADVNGCRPFEGYQCLDYYTPYQIPNLTALASKYVVSDPSFPCFAS